MIPRIDTKEIGQRIARYRAAQKMTQKNLAARTGMHQPDIAAIEGGYKFAMRVDTLVALAQGLGVSADILLGLIADEDDAA